MGTRVLTCITVLISFQSILFIFARVVDHTSCSQFLVSDLMPEPLVHNLEGEICAFCYFIHFLLGPDAILTIFLLQNHYLIASLSVIEFIVATVISFLLARTLFASFSELYGRGSCEYII
jgi:hypothetical protein